jgi:hypothetical protein
VDGPASTTKPWIWLCLTLVVFDNSGAVLELLVGLVDRREKLVLASRPSRKSSLLAWQVGWLRR